MNTVKAQREREVELLEDAARRVRGLPPVTATERVKPKVHEKGQMSLDKLFGKQISGNQNAESPLKRKRDSDGVENQPV